MKAIQVHEFGEPNVLRLEEIADPTPGAGEVVVRLRAIGVNPVETYIRRGIYGERTFPFTPGTDGAGEVESIGDSVTDFQPGERVYVAGSKTGTYAEKTRCDAAQVHRLPDNVTFAQGAAIGVPYATAHQALFGRANAQPGETVLVHGASGGVGIAAVQIARAAGLTVFGTAGSGQGLQIVRANGAHQVYDHHAPGYLAQAVAATPDGAGFDVILEMLANINLGNDLTTLAQFGRVVVIGSRGDVEITPRETMRRDAAILGMVLPNTPPQKLKAIHAALFAGLENSTLNPLVGEQFPLADAARAHEAVIAHEGGAQGKIVLVT